MLTRNRLLAGAAALAAASFVVPAFAQEPIKRFQAVADRLVDAINGQDHPRIQKDFAKVMLDALPPAKSTPTFKLMCSSSFAAAISRVRLS